MFWLHNLTIKESRLSFLNVQALQDLVALYSIILLQILAEHSVEGML